MKIYTTPTLTFRVDGDFTDCEIIITFQQGRWSLNKRPERVWLSDDKLYTKMQMTLQQEDLADVDPTKSVYIQSNFFWKNGARAASNVVRTNAGNNLLDREYPLSVTKANIGYTAGGQIILHVDESIDTSPVQWNTQQYWESHPEIVSKRGAFYVYIDRVDEKSVLDGKSGVSFKVGDGNSYVIDLPFFSQERQGIYYHTDEEWAERDKNRSEAGSIYIYSDHNKDGDKLLPAVKIGDGNSYIVDLPFAYDSKKAKEQEETIAAQAERIDNLEKQYTEQQKKLEQLETTVTENSERLDKHIADPDKHVTPEERKLWNGKTTMYVDDGVLVATQGFVPEGMEV